MTIRLLLALAALAMFLANAASLLATVYGQVAVRQLRGDRPDTATPTLQIVERLSPARISLLIEDQHDAVHAIPQAKQRALMKTGLSWQPASVRIWHELSNALLITHEFPEEAKLSIAMVHSLAPQSPVFSLGQFILGAKHWWRADEETQNAWRADLQVALNNFPHLTRTVASNRLEFQACQLAQPWLKQWCSKASWLRKHCNEPGLPPRKKRKRKDYCERRGFFSDND